MTENVYLHLMCLWVFFLNLQDDACRDPNIDLDLFLKRVIVTRMAVVHMAEGSFN